MSCVHLGGRLRFSFPSYELQHDSNRGSSKPKTIAASKVRWVAFGGAIVPDSAGPQGLRCGLGARSRRRDRVELTTCFSPSAVTLRLRHSPAVGAGLVLRPRTTGAGISADFSTVSSLRTWNSGPARDRPSICSWCVLPRATNATLLNYPQASSPPSTSFPAPNAAPCPCQRPQLARELSAMSIQKSMRRAV